jgi:uncharacterized RDD family membrane protein YckC
MGSIAGNNVNAPEEASSRAGNWRNEVASRVNSYRARRTVRSRDKDSFALDFGPDDKDTQAAAGVTKIGSKDGTADRARPAATARAEDARKPSRNAFDTNYYRRLNAESMAQGPALLIGATTAATASALEMDEVAETGESAADIETPHETAAETNSAAADLELRPAVSDDSVLERYCISEAEPVEPEPAPPAPPQATPSPAPTAQGNLLVFRRPLLEPPLVPQPSGDELAEPMFRRPRILEVPEDIMPAVQGSLFPEIRLDADVPESQGIREPEIEVPLRVAPLGQRLMASLTDLGVVLAAGVLFGAIAFFALPDVPHAKPFWMILAAVTMLLWGVYQHLYLLYAGRTLGMSLHNIHLKTYGGQTPPWSQRCRRAHFMCISFVSVGLGFLWSLVDEDALCWHDRVSQTFPTTE